MPSDIREKGTILFGMKKKRNGEIEILRFLFCMYIFLRHGAPFLKMTGSDADLFARGALGVDFFFIVSGYFMAASAAKKNSIDPQISAGLGSDTVSFINHKFSSLMPQLLVAWCIGLAVDIVKSQSFGVKAIAKKLTTWIWDLIPLSEAGFSTETHMGVWYISAMLLAMFILYPFCRKHYEVFTKIAAPLLAIFIIGYLAMVSHTTLNPHNMLEGTLTLRGMARSVGVIALGAACFEAARTFREKTALTRAGQWCMTLLMIALLVFILYDMTFVKSKVFDIMTFALIALLSFCAFVNQGVFAHIFDNKVCYFLGRMSLLLYLCHIPMVAVVRMIYKSGSGLFSGNADGDAIICYCLLAVLTVVSMAVVSGISSLINKITPAISRALVRTE